MCSLPLSYTIFSQKNLRNVKRARVQSATVLHNILPKKIPKRQCNQVLRHLYCSDYCPSNRVQTYFISTVSFQTTTQMTAPYHKTCHTERTMAAHPDGRVFKFHCRVPSRWVLGYSKRGRIRVQQTNWLPSTFPQIMEGFTPLPLILKAQSSNKSTKINAFRSRSLMYSIETKSSS